MLKEKEAIEERQGADNEVSATRQAISKIKSEISAYELELETLDNLEKQIGWAGKRSASSPTPRIR